MTEYCEICSEELDQQEEEDGICKKCKKAEKEEGYEVDENYIDPGIT